MNFDTEKIMLSYIKDYRDPFIFYFSGFLIGKGWYIFGILLTFICIYALTKNTLIKDMFKSSSKLYALYSLNIVIGICSGYWNKILIDDFLILSISFFIVFIYLNIILYKKILLEYVQINIRNLPSLP